MALAQSSKKEGSRRREPKHPEWSQGGPKKKRKTLVALQKNVGWAALTHKLKWEGLGMNPAVFGLAPEKVRHV